MRKGFLLSFEGGEACGKSTQVRLLREELERRKEDFLFVREPGGTESGEKIREILLNGKQDLSAISEFLLFSASRSILVDELILPALEEGKLVVMDRFFDSSFVYQGYAGNVDLEQIRLITNIATKNLVPDLTILLNLDPKIAFERKNANDALKNLDRIERKGMQFHQKVHDGYLEIAKDNPSRVVMIDATLSEEKIHQKIMAELSKRLAKKNSAK